jgi:alkaline phosphatase
LLVPAARTADVRRGYPSRAAVRMRGTGLLFAVLAALVFAPASAFCAQARNVVLLIGDGMEPSHIWAAQLYATRELGRSLHMVRLMNGGHTAYLVNDTADAIVTESAAAATQIACGVRVPARAVGMGPDATTPCRTVLELAKDLGMATGLVTTSGITDATPAAFSAHVSNRSDEISVAAQQLRLGVDVLLGGARRFFLPEAAGGSRRDGRDLVEEAGRAGYALPRTGVDLAGIRNGRILGLFSTGNMAFDIDRPATAQPSLAEMAAKALAVLAQNPRGMFAMIEGGRIDHAAHGNDAAATIRDVLSFDEAVGVALAFQQSNPDTLVIVTSDHETGGMALTGLDKGTSINFSAIRNARGSLEVLLKDLGEHPPAAAVRDAVNHRLALAISEEEANALAGDLSRTSATQSYIPTPRSLVSILQRHLGVGWATQGHTASPVFAFGSGPGSERIVGFSHNTELFQIMRESLGHSR